MSGESDWVRTIKPGIEKAIEGLGVKVLVGKRLPYSLQAVSYESNGEDFAIVNPSTKTHGYQTDLLLADEAAAGWVPRVVVEFKLGKVSTHDALTYSAKAATHKSVHPYLRYGIVIGDYAAQVPVRLMRHGHHFDFMATIASKKLTSLSRELASLLAKEVEASRTIGKILSEKSDIRLFHRQLVVQP